MNNVTVSSRAAVLHSSRHIAAVASDAVIVVLGAATAIATAEAEAEAGAEAAAEAVAAATAAAAA